MNIFEFNSKVPFPLVPEEKYSYALAQAHSAKVDRWLGLETDKVEKELETKGCRLRAPNSKKGVQELWIGLASKSLLTPYIEIRNILNNLNPQVGDTIVDLGAGYGRMGFVIARHWPGVKFVGYEYSGERVRATLKCYENLEKNLLKLVHADLSDPEFVPARAQFYFIYDFGSRNAIRKTLHDLRRIAKDGPITVVGRGRSSRDLIERQHPWLSKVVPPVHGPQSTIYRSSYINET